MKDSSLVLNGPDLVVLDEIQLLHFWTMRYVSRQGYILGYILAVGHRTRIVISII